MMKLLFVCDACVKDGALSCSSWMRGIITELEDDFCVTILSSDSQFSEDVHVSAGNKKLRWIPNSLWNSAAALAAVVKEETADLIVIFGTEKDYTLSAASLCRDLGLTDKTILFAQGLACACAEHYCEGVPSSVVDRWTFRDILRRENIRKEKERMEEKAEGEQKAIGMIKNFIGRTSLDKAVFERYQPDGAYYKCNDLLRSCFYQGQWQYASCEKHRIFISQYYYPLKGFHYLLKAASALVERYPDLMIAAAGYNPIKKSLTQKELKDSSYIRYIKALVRSYQLQDHITLLGELSEEEMKKEYLKANVFILPSTIENSPNSLAEAMMLGVPTIASDVGGVADFAEHEKEAYLYPSSDTEALSRYIDAVFGDPEKAEKLGANGKIRAEKEYDKNANIKRLEDVFRQIVQKS